MIFHHYLWPQVPQRMCWNEFLSKSGDTPAEARVAKDSDGKSYTHSCYSWKVTYKATFTVYL